MTQMSIHSLFAIFTISAIPILYFVIVVVVFLVNIHVLFVVVVATLLALALAVDMFSLKKKTSDMNCSSSLSFSKYMV